MKREKFKINESYVCNTRHNHKKHISELSAKLIGYHSDNERKSRHNENLCRYCFYYDTQRVGGSAITTVPCSECESDIVFSNTCVDLLCDECAKKLKKCKHCGLKIDYC